MKKLVFDLYPYNGGSAFLRRLLGAAKRRGGIPQPLRAGKDLNDRAGHERGRTAKERADCHTSAAALVRNDTPTVTAEAAIPSPEGKAGCRAVPGATEHSDEETLRYYRAIMQSNMLKQFDLIARLLRAAAAISGKTLEEEYRHFQLTLIADNYRLDKALIHYLANFGFAHFWDEYSHA